MNKLVKISVTAIAFLGGLACIGELAVIAGQSSTAHNTTVTAEYTEQAPTSQAKAVSIDLPPMVITVSKASPKVNQAPAIAARVHVTRLRVLEQGGRPGGEFVLATE